MPSLGVTQRWGALLGTSGTLTSLPVLLARGGLPGRGDLRLLHPVTEATHLCGDRGDSCKGGDTAECSCQGGEGGPMLYRWGDRAGTC